MDEPPRQLHLHLSTSVFGRSNAAPEGSSHRLAYVQDSAESDRLWLVQLEHRCRRHRRKYSRATGVPEGHSRMRRLLAQRLPGESATAFSRSYRIPFRPVASRVLGRLPFKSPPMPAELSGYHDRSCKRPSRPRRANALCEAFGKFILILPQAVNSLVPCRI